MTNCKKNFFPSLFPVFLFWHQMSGVFPPSSNSSIICWHQLECPTMSLHFDTVYLKLVQTRDWGPLRGQSQAHATTWASDWLGTRSSPTLSLIKNRLKWLREPQNSFLIRLWAYYKRTQLKDNLMEERHKAGWGEGRGTSRPSPRTAPSRYLHDSPTWKSSESVLWVFNEASLHRLTAETTVQWSSTHPPAPLCPPHSLGSGWRGRERTPPPLHIGWSLWQPAPVLRGFPRVTSFMSSQPLLKGTCYE